MRVRIKGKPGLVGHKPDGNRPSRPRSGPDYSDAMADSRPANPPPLTVAVSLVAVQGLVLIALGVAEAFSVVGDRLSVAMTLALTIVAFQTVVADFIPKVTYV